MRKKMKPALIGLVVLGLCISFSTWRNQVLAQSRQEQSTQEIRAAVANCIPDHPPGMVKAVDLTGLVTVEGRTYYYFYAYDQPIPDNPEPEDPDVPNYQAYPSNLVISVGEEGCRQDHFNPMNDPIPLAETIPLNVAKRLVLDRYERTIEQIGREGLQARINRWSGDGSLFVEERWALQQLGMQIPERLLN